MSTQVYGIGAAQNPDRVGEVIDIQNINIDNLRYLNDEHSDTMFGMIGAITTSAKIFSEKDCKSDRQKRCWNETKVPFLYIEGVLDDGEESDHPNAKAAGSLLKFCAQHPELPLQVGLSIEGSVIERNPDNKNILSKTKAEGVSLTVKSCNPLAKLYLVNDLLKSESAIDMPEKYKEALKKSEYTPSFKDISQQQIIEKIENLKKSIQKFTDGITSLQCKHCGKSERFFKSSSDIPNSCNACGKGHRIIDIYNALTKEK